MRPTSLLSIVAPAASELVPNPAAAPASRQPLFAADAVDALARLYRFSAGERDVVLLAALRGASMKEAAAELGRSRKTVEQRWRRIYRKCGCQSQLEVIAELLRLADGERGRGSAVAGPGETRPSGIRTGVPANDVGFLSAVRR